MTDTATSPRRRHPRLVMALLGLSVAAGWLGNALTPVLLRDSPVALLALHSSYAQMGLASARVEPLTFIAVAALRRCVGEVIAFAAGRVLGADVMAWYTRRRGSPLTLPGRLDRGWAPARDAAVVFLPHSLLSAFFGMAGMPARRFVTLKLVGSVLSVTVLWQVAGIAGSPITVTADFVEAHAITLTVVTALTLAGCWTWQRRAPLRRSASLDS